MARHFSRLAIAAALMLLAAPAFAQMHGAIFTTTSDGSAVNANIYTSREAVYLNGGPKKAGAAGLPDGTYFVKVTEPNGTLLGSSVYRSNQKPVQVVNGEFADLYQLWSIVNKASATTQQGYDATGNNGGEYKVWVSSVSNFANNASKTDNFKVREDAPPPPPPQTEIVAAKFYDLDLDGAWDEIATEPAIANWPMELRLAADNSLVQSGVTGVDGKITWIVPRDSTQYIIREVMLVPYVSTTGVTSVQKTADVETIIVGFGNVAVQCHLGLGHTRGFWGNQGAGNTPGKAALAAHHPAWAVALNALHLVDSNGNAIGDFSTTDAVLAHSQLVAWMAQTPESNPAFRMSIQFATMVLNVEAGLMHGFPGIFVDWDGERQNLENVFDDADQLLANLLDANPLNDPTAAQLNALQEFFDKMNNNDTSMTHVLVVLPGPVALGVALPCVQPPTENPPPQD